MKRTIILSLGLLFCLQTVQVKTAEQVVESQLEENSEEKDENIVVKTEKKESLIKAIFKLPFGKQVLSAGLFMCSYSLGLFIDQFVFGKERPFDELSSFGKSWVLCRVYASAKFADEVSTYWLKEKTEEEAVGEEIID